MRRRATLTLIAAAVMAARPACADGPPPGMSNEMRAEQLFRSGEKKFDSGQYNDACADFQDSLRIAPKLGTLLNLALCHETVGKYATAWAEYHHGAAWAAQNWQKDRHEFAMQHIATVEMRLPRVSLQLPAERAIASVEVDGEPLPEPRWYLPLYLDPGEHAVAVSAPGKKRSRVTFRVIMSPTEQLVVIPPLVDDPGPPPPPPPPPPPDPRAGRRLVGYVALGAGGVGLGVGATFGVLGLTGDDSALRDRMMVSTVAFVAAGVAAAAGAWLVITSPRPSSPRVAIRPRAGGAELGLEF